MISWKEVEGLNRELAEAGNGLLYQFGVGLAFLATVRRDGGPRVHPMCPLLHDGGLYAFIVPSPKQQDLLRDGRYALHSFPSESNEDAVYLTGVACQQGDPELRQALAEQFVLERAALDVPPPRQGEIVFEFLIEKILWTRTTGHGDPEPVHTVWRPSPSPGDR